MCKETISRLHYGHLGINKTVDKAKGLTYWPNMQKEITHVIKNGSTCFTFGNSQVRETLINRAICTRV